MTDDWQNKNSELLFSKFNEFAKTWDNMRPVFAEEFFAGYIKGRRDALEAANILVEALEEMADGIDYEDYFAKIALKKYRESIK